LASQTPPPATPAPVNLSYLPDSIRVAVETVGADSPAGLALLAAYPRPAAPAPTPAPAPAAAAPAGFGASTAAAPAAQAPAAGVTTAGASLKALLEQKLGIKPAAGA